MNVKLLSAVTVAALLAMPISQAMAAPKPTPPKGDSGGMSMTTDQPPMTGWDMVKKRTTPSMRAAAVRNARLLGKPAQAVAPRTFDPAKGPDYFGSTPNYAYSQLPHITWKNGGGNVILPIYDPSSGMLFDAQDGATVVPSDTSPYEVDKEGNVVLDPINHIPQLDLSKVDVSGGLRKFVEPLPGLGSASGSTTLKNYDVNGGNPATSYIPVAVPDITTYPGSDYYEIGLKDYYQQFSPDLAPTKLRGYYQINGPDPRPYYLGPVIIANADRPVRVKFVNQLPTGSGGDLFLPVDTTAMGAGTGPDGKTLYPQNRAVVHLHGGLSPWISDGTPHQWTTPVGDKAKYPKGVSVYGVPDMPAVQTVGMDGTNNATASDGTLTFYYTNHQSARLMWYHDHAFGLTRLNVYAGEASGYVLQDSTERALVDSGVLPGGVDPKDEGVPLVIQDKTFVPDNTPSGYFPNGQLSDQDPTWNSSKWGGTGSLWFPHVYMPNQNPYDDSGANAMGRWDYGPWFWPVFNKTSGLVHGEIPNPYADPAAPWEPPVIPGTPSTYTKAKGFATSDASLVPEGFMDTPVINGVIYPYMNVDARAYRFRLLNGANDRSFNLQMYCSAADMPNGDGLGLYKKVNTAPMWTGNTLTNPAAGEVPMVPAVETNRYPNDWPTDGRKGGVPDPAARAGNFLQIGTEGGVLPNAVEVRNGPVGYQYNRRDIVVLNIAEHGLLLGPAERADVVYDFSTAANMGCKNVILYNDAPSPVPAFDPRNDPYTNDMDLTDSGGAPSTLPGYGPNMRTIMQFRINTPNSLPAPTFDTEPLKAALPGWFATTQHKPIVPETRYASAYPGDPIGASNVYSRIQSNSVLINASTVGDVKSLNLTNPGSGYAPTVTVTGGGGTGAVLQPVIGANGKIASITIVDRGAGYTSAPTLTISTPVTGTKATARATVNGGGISSVSVRTEGSGYATAATLTVANPPTGNAANGTAIVDMNTGKIALVTLTDVGNGYGAAPAVSLSAPLYVGGVQATANAALSSNRSGGTLIKEDLQPKAIQELFEMDYGRMNATLGVELPFTNSGNQTTLPLGYAEPTTEYLKPSQVGTQIGTARDGTQIWKITHNGVDTHTIHFHLMDVQLVNRVGWDGGIRPPEDNEMGWKESVRMNPLEDAIVALRPATPDLPFKIGDSIRPIDPTMPTDHKMTSLDPMTGNAITFSNAPTNFNWEYVWHCHLLGHEENDMMRAMSFAASPDAPTIDNVNPGPSGGVSGTVNVTWKNNANWQLTNFVVERADDKDFTTGVVQTLSDKGTLTGGSLSPWQGRNTTLGGAIFKNTSFADDTVASGKTYYYRVRAESANGFSQWSDSLSVKAPTYSVPPVAPASPSGITLTSSANIGNNARLTIGWSGLQSSGVNQGVAYTVRWSTSPTFANNVQTRTVQGNSGNASYSVTILNGTSGANLDRATNYYVQIQTVLNGKQSAWTPTGGFLARTQ